MKSIILFASILRIVLITAIISFAVYANAQSVAINTTGNSADASAMLDISSTSKGFLPPRMTTIQRTSIVAPVNGLMVFDTDTKTVWYFSTTWKEITNGGGGGSFALPYSGTANIATPAFSITNTSTNFSASALMGRMGNTPSGVAPLGNAGVWGDNATGIGVAGTSKSIGVFGVTGVNDPNGMGVLGINSSTTTNNGAVTAINQSSGTALYAESLDSGVAVYGKTTRQNGAAIYGINNAVQGHAIRGAATGNGGVAIYGEAGNAGSTSYAGYFRNSNASNGTNVVQIDNLGTGNSLAITNGLGDTKTMITKNGDISTDGNIFTQGAAVVRGNKGIVRNSNGNQLRMELMQIAIPGKFFPGGEFLSSQDLSFNFSTPFSAPPAVYIANEVGNSNATHMTTYISNVTVSGFTVTRVGFSFDYTSTNSQHRIIIVGNE